MALCGDMDSLREDYFSDRLDPLYNGASKSNPKLPACQSEEALWIHFSNPPWVQDAKPGMQRPAQDRGSYLEKGKQAVQIHYRTRQREEKLDRQVVQEDPAALVALLKACTKQKDLCKGSSIHADLRKSGLLGKNVHVSTALVNMYAKCGVVAKAQEVFDELPVWNVVSWNALIAGYAQNGHAHEAFKCFQQMHYQGLTPDAITFTCILMACTSLGSTKKGEEIHAEIVKQGLLEKDIIIGNAVVDMYAKCGGLAKAQEMFDVLPTRNVVSWNVLIAGYEQCGHSHEALNCFEWMQNQGLSPNAVTFICILKACGSVGASDKGEEIHAEVARQGLLDSNTIVGTALVGMYAKCGELAKAQEVFDELPVRNVVSWNALITGYMQHGNSHEALNCFDQMVHQGFTPDVITFTCILKACGSIGSAEKGKKVHAEVARQGLLKKDTILGTALVDMYAKCGALAKAQQVFDELPVRDVLSWSVLIVGYSQQGHPLEALNCFDQMLREGLSPDAVTFTCILEACSNTGAAEKVEKIHADIVRQGLLKKDTILGNCLVSMYARCGALAKAQEVFNELAVQDVVSWGALITAFAQHGHVHEALKCFEWMQIEGVSPDAVTITCILKACGSIRASEKGAEIHAEIIRQGLLSKDIILGTALVDMYANCGALWKARELFDQLQVQDIVMWRVLIAGYAQYGHDHEALNCCEQMQYEGFSPDAVTFTCILKACGNMGAAEKGEEIHAEVVRQGLLKENIILGNALMDMYAKCGTLAKAREVFDELPVQDAVSWSALIAGYAQLGNIEEVFCSFNKMVRGGVKPDLVTFIVLLKACSHSGLVNEGQIYFMTMNTTYGIIPTIEHHTCMVDLFGRAGHFDKAIGVIQRMPPAEASDYLPLWSTLLGACQKWGDVKVGRLAFERAVQLNEENAAAYVCMSSIYEAASMQEEANKM